MQNRVSLYPGRVKLVPVPGQENTYDMVRADSPTQEGTPLNKDSLLKDATAELYGLGSDAAPDDVLQAIFGRLSLYRELKRYETAGAFEFVVPPNISNILAIIISGGNGGGAVSDSFNSSEIYEGSASGGIGVFSAAVTEGDVFQLVVGSGGSAVTASYGAGAKRGGTGGTSSFGGKTVPGGTGIRGRAPESSENEVGSPNLFNVASSGSGLFISDILALSLMYALYKEENLLSCLQSGGGARVYSNNRVYIQSAATLPNGKKSSACVNGSSGTITGVKATDFGAGGGDAVIAGSSGTAKSAPGMNGVIAVWGY